MGPFLWVVVVVLFFLWVFGLAMHIAGALIHLLLVVIAILVVINLILGRGARA